MLRMLARSRCPVAKKSPPADALDALLCWCQQLRLGQNQIYLLILIMLALAGLLWSGLALAALFIVETVRC